MKLVRVKKTFSRKEWGCPRTRNRSNWCHAWCVPHDGIGDCGRVAPHALMGRTQRAISCHRGRSPGRVDP
jgi:hypothetical protein